MYLSCHEDDESLVMFNGCVRSYTLGLRGTVGKITHYHSVLKNSYSPLKRGFLLVQHYDHDLDVLRYHGRPHSS